MSARDDLIDEYGRADTEPLGTLSELKQKLDEIRIENRTETLAEVTAWLVKKAREFHVSSRKREREQGDTCAVLASKIARGAVRPDNLRMLPDAGFFEVDHTYVGNDSAYDWKFRVDAITTHPEDGERTALGWRFFNGAWTEITYGEGDWEIHQLAGIVDVTEAGPR